MGDYDHIGGAVVAIHKASSIGCITSIILGIIVAIFSVVWLINHVHIT